MYQNNRLKEGISVKFKTLQMIIDGHSSLYDDIKSIVQYGSNKYYYNKEVYLINKIIINNRYLWMYCQYNNSKLYGDVVFDTENEKQLKNKRRKNEIELRKQLFCAFDIDSQILYINDYTKKGIIKSYVSDTLQKEAIIKNIYSSLEEFQEGVKFLKKVKFTQYRNVVNTLDKKSIFTQQTNILGLDLPDKITMQVEYTDTLIGKVKNGMQELKQKRDQGLFTDIIVIGEDDFGIEQSFDFRSVIKNIEINVNKNEDDRYNDKEVEDRFFEKIG